MQSNKREGILKFAKPDQVLYQRASATITSYLSEADSSGNEIGVAHGSVFVDPTHLDAINYPIANLFLLAISGISFKKSLTAKHICLNVNEGLREKLMLTNIRKNKLDRMAEIAWYQKNSYCIHVSDEGDEQTKYAIMLKHLNTFFHETYGLKGWLESKQVKCFALIRTSQICTPVRQVIDETENEYIEASGKPADLAYLLNSHKNNFLDCPIIDETDFSGVVTIKIPADLSSVDVINTELKPYGLKLVEAEKKIRVVVIESTD